MNKSTKFYLLVSSRNSLSLSLRGKLGSVGEQGLAVGRISFMGVVCSVSSGSTGWSGTITTGVSGSVYCSSGVLSSISNEDCSWSFSSERKWLGRMEEDNESINKKNA